MLVDLPFTMGKRAMLRRVSRVITVGLLLGAGCAAAEIYRCEGPGGRTLYGDSPCPKGTAVSREISQQVGACVTEACDAKVRVQTEAAHRRLQEEKAELARMQDLRIRQEEAWARIVAVRQAAEVAAAAYEPPREEYVVWGGYPGWFGHRRFNGRQRQVKCDFDPRCVPAFGPRRIVQHSGQARPRPAPLKPGPGLRLAIHR